jgi:putative NADH-flavin reductase
MRITLFAATGGVGREFLDQALAVGHHVTAVVRNPQMLRRQVPAVRADLATPDPAVLASAIKGADVVVSCLGARTAQEAGIAWKGTKAIAQAMQATGVRRIIVVSAAPIGTVSSPAQPNPPKQDPGDGFFMRHLFSPLIKVAFRSRYADLARMEDLLRDSGLSWTIVRPPRLTNQRRTAKYRTAYGQNLRRGLTISRADVADLMLRLIETPDAIEKVVGVAY